MNYKLTDNTYVQRSEVHGWGVFAKADIKEGDVIMECVIPMEGLDGDMMLMRGYRFSTENDGEDTIPLGNAAVINYGKGDNANCVWQINTADRLYRGLASKDIPKDTEVLWDYFEGREGKDRGTENR